MSELQNDAKITQSSGYKRTRDLDDSKKSKHTPDLGGQKPTHKRARISTDQPLNSKSYVINRVGNLVPVEFDLITKRNAALCERKPKLNDIDCVELTQRVVSMFKSGMSTRQIDELTVNVCEALSINSSDYTRLAARICVSDMHKRTPNNMLKTVQLIAASSSNRYATEFIGLVTRLDQLIEQTIRYQRDYNFQIFGLRTLARAYLHRAGERINRSSLSSTAVCELPQHFYMRVAISLFCGQPDRLGHLVSDEVLHTRFKLAARHYHLLSTFRISHATPTLLNAGTTHPQLASCFLTATADSADALLGSLKVLGMTSKLSGGISMWLHNIRSDGSTIKSTGGKSRGIGPYLRVLEPLQLLMDQGGNRPGAFAVYLEPWHADIFTFLEHARSEGVEHNAAQLHYGLWVPDLFMHKLLAELTGPAVDDGKTDPLLSSDWHLFDPAIAPDLHTVWGKKFEQKYVQYVSEGKACRIVKPSLIMTEILKTLASDGRPYFMFKDHVNRKTSLKNIATVCSSNLCTEITLPSWHAEEAKQFGGPSETGVCNLAAIVIPKYFLHEPRRIDFKQICIVAGDLVEALDLTIDLSMNLSEECQRSNERHRPLGIGLIGLDEARQFLRVPYGSPAALDLDEAIAAAIYYGATKRSIELGKRKGSYPSLYSSQSGERSPELLGMLQPDMWVAAGHYDESWAVRVEILTGITCADWDALRADMRGGFKRNCFTTAYMPTATTANIVGFTESFERKTACMYKRETAAGEFITFDEALCAELKTLNMWNDATRDSIISSNGSVQQLKIPDELKRLFRTAREIDPRFNVRHAARRGPFVDQSQSINYHVYQIQGKQVISTIFDAWLAGLKTASYYFHSSAASSGQKITFEPAELVSGPVEKITDQCSRKNPDCVSCSV